MGKKTERPRSSTPGPAEAEGGTLPAEVLRFKEYAIETFRENLGRFLDARSSRMCAGPDGFTLIASGSLTSILQMIEEGGECPLSLAEFSRIVGESSFREVIRAVEPSVQESNPLEPENWNARNERRLALIRNGLAAELTPEEQSDLQQLQAALQLLGTASLLNHSDAANFD